MFLSSTAVAVHWALDAFKNIMMKIGPNAPALDALCICMMQISSMYIGHEEDFIFISFNHFQSKCPLGTGPW